MSPLKISHVIRGIGEMVETKLAEGWTGYMVTLMYEPIRGGQWMMDRTMSDTVDRIHRRFVTEVYRTPSRYPAFLPILITAKDWPVYKRQKISVRDAVINGGCHQHGVLLMPPWCPAFRLKTTVADHFAKPDGPYLRNGELRRMHVQPFADDRTLKIVDYVLKGLRRYERADDALDDGLIILKGT